MKKHDRKKAKKLQRDKRQREYRQRVSQLKEGSVRALQMLQQMRNEADIVRIVQLFADGKLSAAIATELSTPIETVERVNELVYRLHPKLQELLVAGNAEFLQTARVTDTVAKAFAFFDSGNHTGLRKMAAEFGITNP